MLPVADLRRAIDFYVDVLGFRLGFNAGAYGGVRRDAIEIHFERVDAKAPGERSGCRIEVTGIRRLYADFRAKGTIAADGDIGPKPWGTTEFTVRDPDGNALTFVEVFGLGS